MLRMNFHSSLIIKVSTLLLFLLGLATASVAENQKELTNLKGYWQFSIGDDPSWALTEFDDSRWDKILVPETWEKSGFQNYNGFAWYRKYFTIEVPENYKFLYLNMGYIDDVDEVFLNGVKIGATGDFPPHTKSAWDIPRMYPIPVELLNPSGKNVIAVRVFDEYMSGGIIRGDVNISVERYQTRLDLDLSGYWEFESGKQVDKGNLDCTSYKKGKIFVPGFWEARGYNEMDGVVSYIKKFRYPADMSTGDMMLFLGVVDDKDRVYLNGENISSTNNFRPRYRNNYHMAFRAYAIPEGLLNKGDWNEIEVEVEDFTGPGGIYKGPIGIIKKEKAIPIIERSFRDDRSNFEKFLDYIFN